MIRIHLSKEEILRIICEKYNIQTDKTFFNKIKPKDAMISWEGNDKYYDIESGN